MSRLISRTRYLVIFPIMGLGLAAAVVFVLGGIGLVTFLIRLLLSLFAVSDEHLDSEVLIYELVQFVHTFLVGTVIYITAIGLYQLFISEIELPAWLEIHNTEELENNLISVTVVVLAVDLMGTVLLGQTTNLLDTGAGIALPIAALALFVGLRAWATNLGKRTSVSRASATTASGNQPANEAPEQGEH